MPELFNKLNSDEAEVIFCDVFTTVSDLNTWKSNVAISCETRSFKKNLHIDTQESDSLLLFFVCCCFDFGCFFRAFFFFFCGVVTWFVID